MKNTYQLMNLRKHYDYLWHKSLSQFEKGAFEQDLLIDDKKDKRYGITLLARPSQCVKNHLQHFLSQLKEVEPDQYYYPDSDIHITVMSIISCHEGFHLGRINVEDYMDMMEKSIHGFRKFKVTFKGLTASPSCILIQGFPLDDTINDIRNCLRVNFSNSSLQQSIDQRYSIQTAHSTVVRFRKPLEKAEAFIRILKEYRNQDFGTFEIKNMELVYNDWYQRKGFVSTLQTFPLR